MSKIIHKSCGHDCEICRGITLGAYVLDDSESACYWDNFHITPTTLFYVNNGYVHTLLRNKKNLEGTKTTINLLLDDVHAEYMFDLLEDIDELPDTI